MSFGDAYSSYTRNDLNFIGSSKRTIAQYLDNGGNPNVRNDHDRPLLWICVHKQQQASVELLVKAGADVGMVDRQTGRNIITEAIIVGARPTIDFLLENGAVIAPFSHRKSRCTLFHWIMEQTPDPHLLADLLLDRGFDINAQNIRGFTPLMFLMRGRMSRWFDTTQLMLESGADASVVNDEGQTAFDMGQIQLNKTRSDSMDYQSGRDALTLLQREMFKTVTVGLGREEIGVRKM